MPEHCVHEGICGYVLLLISVGNLFNQGFFLWTNLKIHKRARDQERGETLTQRPLYKRFIVVWKWSPVLSMCSRVWRVEKGRVEDGGAGWVMSHTHMLASVPDLLVSPVRHVTQQGAVCAPVCCVCLAKNNKGSMEKLQNTPHSEASWICDKNTEDAHRSLQCLFVCQ